jgi:hypothetical protein
MCVNAKCLIQILKPKYYVFVGFDFLEVKVFIDVQLVQF